MNLLLNRLETIFTIVALIFFTGVLACDSLYVTADSVAEIGTSNNPIYRILSLLQILIYLTTVGLLLVHWRGAIVAAFRNPPVWLLVALVLFSFFWSDFPEESLRKGISAAMTSLFGLYFAARYDLKQQLRLFTIALILVSVFALLFTIAIPSAGIEQGINQGAWRGPFTQKNLMGRLMVFTIILCSLDLLASRRRNYWLGFGIVIASGLLVATGSKTGLLVLFFLGLLFPLGRMIRLPGMTLIPTFSILIIFVGGIVTALVSHWENLLVALGRDATLSGRTVLWNLLFHSISQRPWFGYGFRAFWQIRGAASSVWDSLQYKPPHAHNGYLNTTVDLGIVGLSLFLLSMAIAYRRALTQVRIDPTTIGLLPIMSVTFLFLYNFSESTMIEHNSVFWVEFVAVASSLKRLKHLKADLAMQPV